MNDFLDDENFLFDRNSVGFESPICVDAEYRYDPRSGTIHVYLNRDQWSEARGYLSEPKNPSEDQKTNRENVLDLLLEEIGWGVVHEYWHSACSETNAIRLITLLNLVNYYYAKGIDQKVSGKEDCDLEIGADSKDIKILHGFRQIENIVRQYVEASELAMELFTYLSQPVEEDIWKQFKQIYDGKEFQILADEAITLSDEIGRKASADLFQRLSWAALNPEFRISRETCDFPTYFEQVLQEKYLPDNRVSAAIEFISKKNRRDQILQPFLERQENYAQSQHPPIELQVFNQLGLPTSDNRLFSLNPRDNVFDSKDYLGRFNSEWGEEAFGRTYTSTPERVTISSLDLPKSVGNLVDHDEVRSILRLSIAFTGPIHFAIHTDDEPTIFVLNPRLSYENLQTSLKYLLSNYQKEEFISRIKAASSVDELFEKINSPFDNQPPYVAGRYYQTDHQVLSSN